MSILVFLLISYGACNNMIFGSIFEWFREFLAKFGTGGYSLYKLFTCFMCLSTWMGFAISAILLVSGIPTPIHISNPLLCVFFHGLLSTGGVWIIHNFEEMLERAFKNETQD